MLRSIPRLLRRAVIVAVILAVSASVYQSWAAGSPGTAGWAVTADRPRPTRPPGADSRPGPVSIPNASPAAHAPSRRARPGQADRQGRDEEDQEQPEGSRHRATLDDRPVRLRA